MNSIIESEAKLVSENNSKIFKILVVDDNLQNIQLLGNVLRKRGYSVGFATNGQQALLVLEHSRDYDLILLDVDMPVMNGYETCRNIRGNGNLQDTPIIFLTAFTDTEQIIAGFKAGAQDYVTKPFNSDELLARVETQLQLKYKSEALKDLNRTLEQKVLERTAELTEANKKLALLDKAKNDFLLLISHEMRTPLNGIVGLSELLKTTPHSESQAEFLEYLIQSAQKLLKFSDSALLFTHLQLQGTTNEKEKCSITRIFEKVKTDLAAPILEKNLNLTYHSLADGTEILANNELIEVSLKRLLENAIKFSPENSEICLECKHSDEGLMITLKDEGPGFSEEAIHQQFELFNTSDIAHHSEGFGLSLATVKLIMDVHKGNIQIKNRENGAEVILTLPRE